MSNPPPPIDPWDGNDPYGAPPPQEPQFNPSSAQYGHPGGYPPSAGDNGYGYAGAVTNQKALWSLIVGIGSFFCCGIVTGIIAVVLAMQAGDEIRASGGTQTGDGMAKAGMILGIIGAVVNVLAIVVFMLAMGTAGLNSEFSNF